MVIGTYCIGICKSNYNAITTTTAPYLIDWFLVLNATFSNISAISWRPVLVGEESGVPGENHRQGQANGKLYHLRMPVECTFFCNLQSKFNVSTCNCNNIFVPGWNLFRRNLFHRNCVLSDLFKWKKNSWNIFHRKIYSAYVKFVLVSA